MIYDCNKLNAFCSTKIYSLFLILCLMLVGTSFGQTQLFTTSGDFIVPAGVTSITVECWGAGGGGQNGSGGGGNGGGGGGYAKSTLTGPFASSYTYVVGSGGSGNSDGGDSSFGSTLLVAKGGKTDGTGGTGNTGTTTFDGGNGGDNPKNKYKGGAGGGSAAGSNIKGYDGVDANGNSGTVGGAAVAGGGKGGNGGSSGYNGLAGSAPGGGGGGAGKGQDQVGGKGGDGQVNITYTCPTYSISTISATNSCVSSGTATVDVTGTATGLPIGNYTVEYRLSYNGYSTVYTATMTVSTAGVGTFTANVSIVNVNSDTKIKIYKLTSASCTTTLSKESNISYKKTSLGKPEIKSGYAACSIWKAQWKNANSDGYYLDVATTKTFTAGTFLPGFENLPILSSFPDLWNGYDITGLTPGNTYYYRVRSYNDCGISVYSDVVTFVAGGAVAPTISTITQPSCSSSTGSFTITNYVSWYDYTISPSVGVVRSNAFVTAPQGNYTISVTYSNCTSAATSFTINNQITPPATPTVAPTQPTCTTSTGSVFLSGLPTSGTVYQSGTTTANYPYTGILTTKTISSLTPGTYTFTVFNGTCFSASSAAVTINPIETKTWNGTTWSGPYTESAAPTLDQNIEFSGDYNKLADVDGCSCKVNSGKTVNFNSGYTLKLTNELNVLGTIFFKDQSSLVQINDAAVNSGVIGYERKVSNTILETDYTYWSSPVIDFKLGDVYLNNTTGLYYSYNSTATPEDWQWESSGTKMKPGIGYIINGKKPYVAPSPPLPAPLFVGKPNNGKITVPVSNNNPLGLATTDPNYGVSYLLGNPYPSALNAETFLNANEGVLKGTLYFWTHNTEIQDRNNFIDPITNVSTAGSGAYAYTSDDYATYNATGGVAVNKRDIDPSTNLVYEIGGQSSISVSDKPTGYIAAGQGFFGTVYATGNVEFTNNMRIGGITLTDGTKANEQFFKKRGSTKETVIEKNRIWLNLTNAQGAFKQLLVGYITNATNEHDIRFDGESYDGNAFIDFYSINQDRNLTIQGRALPFNENDEVPLGFTTTIDGPFTISIDEVDGSLENQAVFIEDKLTNTTFNLKKGNYTFSTVEGTFDDRFVLRYKDTNSDVNDNSLSAADFDAQSNKVLVSLKNKEIKVNSFSETIDKVVVFDLLGRQVYKKDQVNSNELSIVTLSSSHQALIVKTTLQNGVLVTDKIIY